MIGGMSAAAELLRTYRPFLKYDSQEFYFADSAAEWTDNPGNRLTDKAGNAIATAGHGLSRAFLGPRYANGRAATPDDRIPRARPGRQQAADRPHRDHQLAGRGGAADHPRVRHPPGDRQRRGQRRDRPDAPLRPLRQRGNRR